MQMLCLDGEGVLFPEFWALLASRSGIEGLGVTTREQLNFPVLIAHHLALLSRHRLTLADARAFRVDVEPLLNAAGFLARQRATRQIVLVSDSFYELLDPLMPKLNHPTLLCHHLAWDTGSVISGWHSPDEPEVARPPVMKSLGLKILTAGGLYNDLPMLQATDHGWFVNTPPHIRGELPHLSAPEDLTDLERHIETVPMRTLDQMPAFIHLNFPHSDLEGKPNE